MVALLRFDVALRTAVLAWRLLLLVIDELVFEVAPGELARLEALVRREMAAAADLKVPLEVSVGLGRTWHEAGH
jgi:DNA polymerase-1